LLFYITAAFVEVGSNYSVLDQPELCFVYEFVGTKDGNNDESQVVKHFILYLFIFKR